MSPSACAYFSSETGGKLPQLLKTGSLYNAIPGTWLRGHGIRAIVIYLDFHTKRAL